MQLDDRLATVLRLRADGDAALRTQFRQLLDLLGSSRRIEPEILARAAYLVLGDTMKRLPQDEQARILREPGIRLRNKELVEFLAAGAAKPAASAMATARLQEDEWLALIPGLPVTARGFLRHRRDLSPPIKAMLERLGVGDLVLTDADPGRRKGASAAAPSPVRSAASPATEGIGALLRRIEQFREQRGTQPLSQRLPIGEQEPHDLLDRFEFTSDARGEVIRADEAIAPFIVGMRLTGTHANPLVQLGDAALRDFGTHQPLHAQPIVIDAARQISGEWLLDAAPLFDFISGSFTGYRGCVRRPRESQPIVADSEADTMRQVLHELRTPVNAIQGFAEIIQQQLFGAAPHEYRAHAASIAVDSARLLAGFDEVDRLVKLEADAMVLDKGSTDFHVAVSDTVHRLETVLSNRGAGFTIDGSGGPFTVAMTRDDAMTLCWRLLATAASVLAPGEQIALNLQSDGRTVRLDMDMPRSLTGANTSDQSEKRRRAVSTGMFGPEFSFRLAQAEIRVAGGALNLNANSVALEIPALTAESSDNSDREGHTGG